MPSSNPTKSTRQSTSSPLPQIQNPDSIDELLKYYNADNLPSNHLILPKVPARLQRLVPSEFTIREQNFHIFFFLWYSHYSRLPASLPKIAQEYTNFYALYRVVTLKMGGYDRISHSKDGEWATIWKNSPNYSASATSSASSRVKSTYGRFLYPFEKEFFKKGRLMAWKMYRNGDADKLQLKDGEITAHRDLAKKASFSQDEDVSAMQQTVEPVVSGENASTPKFIMETTWTLIETQLATDLINTDIDVQVEQHFISFPFQKLKSHYAQSSAKEEDDYLASDVTLDYVTKIQIGDIVYSDSLKLVRLVISTEAPLDNDFELIGRITPSADFTHDDIFSIVEELDLQSLINVSKSTANSPNSPQALKLSIQAHEVKIQQHSRPPKGQVGQKRKRRSNPKKPKKSKRLKDGKEEMPEDIIMDEDDDFFPSPHNAPIAPRAALPTTSAPAVSSRLSNGATAASNNRISTGTMTQNTFNIAALNTRLDKDLLLIRYKFNKDKEDDYRVIVVPNSKLPNGEMTYADLREILERDNVAMSAVCDVRYFSQGLSQQLIGWAKMDADWKFSLSEGFSREVTLWLLTKKGYKGFFGVEKS